MANTRLADPLQAGSGLWTPPPAGVDCIADQRSAACASTSPFSSCCSSPRPSAPDPRALHKFLAAARECVITLPPRAYTSDEQPATFLPEESVSPPETGISSGQHGEQLAVCADQSTSHEDHKQQQQRLAAPALADGEQFRDRQWLREGSPDGISAALQSLSPLGAEAAFQMPRSSFEAKWGRWVEVMVDSCMDHTRMSDSAGDLHSEYGGAAAGDPADPEEPAAGSAADGKPVGVSQAEENAMRSDSAAVSDGRLSARTSVAALQTASALKQRRKQQSLNRRPPLAETVEPAAGPAEAQLSAEPEQQRDREASGGATSSERTGPGRAERFWQCFRNAELERRFCMRQAALLRPVDVIGSSMVTVAALATGFVPAPLHAMAPLAWPLVVLSPGGRAMLASRLPQQTYFQWRELIAIVSSLLTLAHGVAVLCPGFVSYLPPSRLSNPLLFLRLIGGEMQLLLGAFNRVRFCVWLPVQLIGNLIAIAALPHMGRLYEAAGAASTVSVVAWGALYHLTLGFLLPGAFLWLLERRERRHFLADQRKAAQADPKVAGLHSKTA